MTQHLYNLAGDFVAFRRDEHDQHVFSATGCWLGWMSHSGQDVYNLAGHYLASVVDDRLLWLPKRPHRRHPGHPGAQAWHARIERAPVVPALAPGPGRRDVAMTTLAPTQHLFNSWGDWVAHRTGEHVFALDGRWVGWLPPHTNLVLGPVGQYIGMLVRGDRLLRQDPGPQLPPVRGPQRPATAQRPASPKLRRKLPLPAGWRDLDWGR